MADIYNDIGKTLSELVEKIANDQSLDEDHRAELIELINDVIADPTPNNLEALALVIEELGKSQEYLAAIDIITKNLSESNTEN